MPEAPDGSLTEHDRDVLGAARMVADGAGGGVIAVLFADQPVTGLGEAGADRVVQIANIDPERRLAALQALAEPYAPRHWVLADAGRDGGHLGRLLAAALDLPVAGSLRQVHAGGVVAAGEGGRHDLHYAEPPPVLLVAPEGAEPATGRAREARPLPAPKLDAEPRVKDLGRLPLDPATVPLAEADFIVSAGAGVADWDAFHRLTRRLGAAEGGSRVVCDAGHLRRERQVGASGTLVSARCYVALGISGASQHLQGIARCNHVIAINADPHAEIMKRADLGLVTDVQGLMRALLAELGEEVPDG